MLDKWGNGELDFMPKCPEYLLREQLATMKDYIGILQTRAKIEGVDLTADVDKAGWIPISERMPEEHNGRSNTMLITLALDEDKSVALSSTENGQWRCGTLCALCGAKITAWMPLPEPYREERTEE